MRQLVVAGGETSGGCVQRLGITRLRIGPQIDPGVPWCHAAVQGLHLALVMGNWARDESVPVRVHEPLTVLDFLHDGGGTHSWPISRALEAIARFVHELRG